MCQKQELSQQSFCSSQYSGLRCFRIRNGTFLRLAQMQWRLGVTHSEEEGTRAGGFSATSLSLRGHDGGLILLLSF